MWKLRQAPSRPICRLPCSSRRSGGSVCDRSLTQPRTPNGAPTNPSWMSADDSPLIVPSSPLCGLLAEAGEKKLDSIGHVSDLSQPMLDPGDAQAQLHFAASRYGIEQPHALEAGAALTLAGVGHHDMVEGGLFAAASSQTDRHHRKFT